MVDKGTVVVARQGLGHGIAFEARNGERPDEEVVAGGGGDRDDDVDGSGFSQAGRGHDVGAGWGRGRGDGYVPDGDRDLRVGDRLVVVHSVNVKGQPQVLERPYDLIEVGLQGDARACPGSPS